MRTTSGGWQSGMHDDFVTRAFALGCGPEKTKGEQETCSPFEFGRNAWFLREPASESALD